MRSEQEGCWSEGFPSSPIGRKCMHAFVPRFSTANRSQLYSESLHQRTLGDEEVRNARPNQRTLMFRRSQNCIHTYSLSQSGSHIVRNGQFNGHVQLAKIPIGDTGTSEASYDAHAVTYVTSMSLFGSTQGSTGRK